MWAFGLLWTQENGIIDHIYSEGMIALAENKKQHYVPKLYMKNFTQDGQLLSVYNIARKQCYSAVPYDDQCYKNYYYGRDAVWEKRLSAMETEWGVLFQKILTKSSLSDADIDAIRQFALYQLQRTVASNEYFVQQKEEFLLEYGKMFYKKRGVPFNETAEAICKERAKRDFSPADWLEFADEFMAYIQDLETVVIEYRTEGELITSDVPVVAINPFHQPSIGYACMGLIILFPISSHILVVLYDSKMYPKNKGKLFIESTDEDEVSNLNALQVISADKILLAEHNESFTALPDNAWESRSINRDQRATTFLGSDDQRLFCTSPRKVIYHCDFSFGAVCHRFKRIPFVCKDAPPRKWDSEWEKKLDMLEQILPIVITSKPELQAQYGLTKKEIRKGCQRMATAAKVYWAQHE